MLQSVVTFPHLLRFLCVNKESGFAPLDGFVGSAPESNKAPYEPAPRPRDASSLRGARGSLGRGDAEPFPGLGGAEKSPRSHPPPRRPFRRCTRQAFDVNGD